MGRLSVAAVVCAAALSTSRASAAPGVPCRFYGLNAGAPVWNGQVILDAPYAMGMASAGARAVRINFRLDGASSWDAGKLAEYDAIVDAAIAAGLEPLGLLAYEAVDGDQVAWNDDPDGDGFNAYVDDFANTSITLLSHFDGRIPRWEIWNEPNCWADPGYASDPQHAGCTYVLPRVFAKMMAEVYVRNEALLEGDVALVSGGLFAHDIGGSHSPATDYLGEVYAQGVWDWFEANEPRRYAWSELGYHVYVEQGQATDGALVGQYADEVRALAGSNQDGAPFAFTEIGWPTDEVSQDVQAQNLTTVFSQLAARGDVTQVQWFTFRDAPSLDFGITDASGAQKAAFAAFQAVASGCVGGTGGSGASGTSAGAAGTGGGTGAGGHVGAGGPSSSSPGGAGPSGAGGSGGDRASGSGSGSGCDCGIPSARDDEGGLVALAVLGLASRRRRRARSATRL